jgi:hypothetical protein
MVMNNRRGRTNNGILMNMSITCDEYNNTKNEYM